MCGLLILWGILNKNGQLNLANKTKSNWATWKCVSLKSLKTGLWRCWKFVKKKPENNLT